MATIQEFLDAQDESWPVALRELETGQKLTHWIWWIFPQLEELGRSPRARHFGLSGAGEAEEYLAHPVLGARLVTASRTLLKHSDSSAEEILGPVDALKVRSCMTLFEAAPGADPVFSQVISTFYGGERCPVTRARLER
ncbi:DUF1810 domain-containing protein [Allosediminivita pacifica]|uniref:Uncharacterized protein (DUF1810 family) n=1 Tax=Allosediminivita pacifica TaxID=1267769 RepID=A0A2T6B5W6_9RHOB|nr:DUF1810 domain-containing protein [Allosediminivita pacifica]PTX51432.1 uncharacterized protein (DUF1810 family) [Allosediminivita pacifica]GGA99789.1 calpastatin [Allosediminivita pacifica]